MAKDPALTRMYESIHLKANSTNPDRLYEEIANLYKTNFQDLLAKAKDNNKGNDTRSFIRRNAGHEKIAEYEKFLAAGEFKKCSDIQKEVSRDNWRSFLASSKVHDLRSVFHYFAKIEGRGSTGGKPSCLDPLIENGETAFHPQEKAEMLGRFFESKMAAIQHGVRVPVEELRQEVSRLTPGGKLKLTPAIQEREIRLAVKDIPRNRAAGPALFPAEMYIRCPSMHKGIAALFTSIVENNRIPRKLRHFYVVPLDKAGKDPKLCANKRPIALLSPLVKLLEMVLVRRMMPFVEHRISCSQYAYQRARSTEILLADLDRFVTEGIRQKKPHMWLDWTWREHLTVPR